MAEEEVGTVPERPGYDALWLWFGLSRANWLTLPRVLMHDMPDDWQAKMAALLKEYDAAFPGLDSINLDTTVSAKRGNRFSRFPDWLVQYRHPEQYYIDKLKEKK